MTSAPDDEAPDVPRWTLVVSAAADLLLGLIKPVLDAPKGRQNGSTGD
ncbi:hypothetical protein ACH4PU_13540 [Streptomyces sp. NPDC021100]